MRIPPGKPAEIDLKNVMNEQSFEIENALKQNLPKLFENLAMGKV